MPTIKPAGIEIFNQFSSTINKTRKALIAQDWFEGNWRLNLSFSGAGFKFQLSKTTWHNHDGQGIHFEFWLGDTEIQRKELPLVLHFEPDTPQRKKFGERFKSAFSKLEGEFSDDKINHRAICDKLQKNEKFTKNGLPPLVVRECSRLQKIAPIINGVLSPM